MVEHRHSDMLSVASRPMSRFHGAPRRAPTAPVAQFIVITGDVFSRPLTFILGHILSLFRHGTPPR